MTERQFRYLVTALLIIPLIVGVDAFLHPIQRNGDNPREILFLVLAVPSIFVAYSAWVYPQCIQEMFGPFRNKNAPQGQQTADAKPAISSREKRIYLFLGASVLGIAVFCIMGSLSIFTIRAIVEKAGFLPTAVANETPTSEVSDLETTATAVPFETEPGMPSEMPLSTESVTPVETLSLTETPTVSATSQVCVVGNQCVVNGVAVTVVSVSHMDSLDPATPAGGNTYLVLNVRIENVNRDEEILYGPPYFSLQDINGSEFLPLSISPEPVLSSGPLPKGGVAEGNLSFEVSAASSGFVVFYMPPIFDGANSIRIEIGQ